MLALVVIAALGVVARWASRGGTSLIEEPARRGRAEEYGLMIPVASPRTERESRHASTLLAAAGVSCREVDTTEGRRVMVWADDVPRARAALDPPR